MKIKKPAKHYFSPRNVVLLVNTGSPQTCDEASIKKFLRVFLSDQRVIKIPSLVWKVILTFFILPRRPKKLLPHYAAIWKSNLSPIEYYTRQLVDGMSNKNIHRDTVFRRCYLYSSPTIQEVIDDIFQTEIPKNIIVLPLFPQNSAVTHGATLDIFYKAIKNKQTLPSLTIINGYHDKPVYISAIAKSIEDFWFNNGKARKLVFSWHGIPQPYFASGDAYYCFCQKSSRLIAEDLGLSKDEWVCSFQSRFGYQKWLTPYTTDVLEKDSNVDVVAPGFAIDCLETLYEIDIELRQGSKKDSTAQRNFRYIKCLNHSNNAVNCYLNLLGAHLKIK